MKTAALVLAGLVSTGTIAGGAIAVFKQPSTPSIEAAAPTSSVTDTIANGTAPQSTAEKSTKAGSDRPRTTQETQPPVPATRPVEGNSTPGQAEPIAAEPKKQPVTSQRSVVSCKVVMAIVNDTNPPLNVRSGPSLETKIIGKVQDGTFVSVKREQNGWFEIAEPVGWIAKSKTANRCGHKVEQVRFSSGKSGTEITDAFLGTGSHKYKMAFGKGQKLTVKPMVGPMPAVISPNGKYLSQLTDNPSSWSTELPSSGEYTFELDSNFRGYKYAFSVEVK